VSEPRLGRVILFAKDVRKLVAFYRDGLGVRAAPSDRDSPGFVTLDAGSCELCIHQISEPYASDVQIDDPPRAREGTPIKLAFLCEDVEALRAELEARGARMGEVRSHPPRLSCDGVDPEGNVFQLANR
jgi:hypothetical protein